MHTDTQEAVIRRAYHLHGLASQGQFDPHIEELTALAAELFELLPMVDDDRLFAMRALALVHSIKRLGRLPELPFHMRQIMARARRAMSSRSMRRSTCRTI